jgi:hypothetical protein
MGSVYLPSSFAMTHAELASATLDAIKARAVAVESPLSEEDVGILDSMNMSYYGCNVRDADEGTWKEKIAWPILRSVAAKQLHYIQVTEVQVSSTMEHVSSMSKETIDEMLIMAKILRSGMTSYIDEVGMISIQEEETKTETKETATNEEGVELPVEISSPATSTIGSTVEEMLFHVDKYGDPIYCSWSFSNMPPFQEESVELKVHDACVVAGFYLLSERNGKDSQIRVEEVTKDGTIGAELVGWNHFGSTTKYCGIWNYDDVHDTRCQPEYVSVSTTATKFKVSVRHTGPGSAGIGMFRAIGTPAPGTESEVARWSVKMEKQRVEAIRWMNQGDMY